MQKQLNATNVLLIVTIDAITVAYVLILRVSVLVMLKFAWNYIEKRKDIAPLIECSGVATGSPHFWP